MSKDAKELLQVIKKKQANWDERSQFKIGKIGNLSQSDLGTIELYAQTYIRERSISSLMKPLGNVGLVLADYGVKADKGFGE